MYFQQKNLLHVIFKYKMKIKSRIVPNALSEKRMVYHLEKKGGASQFEGVLLLCCFQINPKTEVQRYPAGFSRKLLFFSPFGVHTCDCRGEGTRGLSLSREWRNGQDSRWTTKERMVDPPSLCPVLPFILVISPVQSGMCVCRSGTPHKAFSITLREHLFPEPFMFICTSAA